MQDRDAARPFRRRMALMVLCAVAVLALGGSLMAQNGAPSATYNLETGRLPSMVVLFQTNVWINSIIAALSLLAVLVFVFLLITISPRYTMPSWFLNDINNLVMQKNFEEATKLCRANKGLMAATVIQRAVENPGKDHAVILEMVDSEGRRRADILWNRLSYLSDISNVAPMLGLLGTVMGMIQAFFVMPHTTIGADSSALSQAIGGAMATTFFGLIVAILALVFYTFAKSRATRVLTEMEESVHSIADRIKRAPR